MATCVKDIQLQSVAPALHGNLLVQHGKRSPKLESIPSLQTSDPLILQPFWGIRCNFFLLFFSWCGTIEQPATCGFQTLLTWVAAPVLLATRSAKGGFSK